ncbi:retron system putative HNH endonuclease [Pseudomonas grandcourensis]|uniref:retron system putative HNH endonuclease n=1 Tax=Pseudomonas grandcourensis TaxID=3136736 RepID=UPI003265C638
MAFGKLHFRHRGRYPQGTFDWVNLFSSCNRAESCGKHKDKCGYTPAYLIKPDVDEPDDYFVFVSDGTIVPRADLSLAQQRATEILPIFNIDAQNCGLCHMCCFAITGYLQTADELRELAEHSTESDWLPLLYSELVANAHLPFATANRHAFVG